MQKKNNDKGFAALLVCMIAAILASLAYITINIGIGYQKLSNERQLLDSCAISIGLEVINTNNLEDSCYQLLSPGCNQNIVNSNATLECENSFLDCTTLPCKRTFKVKSSYTINDVVVKDEVEVKVAEEKSNVTKIDAGLIFLLDYSGSMSGNRILQLKNAVQFFVSQNYDISYSVLIYNSDIIEYTEIKKGLNHDQNVLSIINNNRPNGGTNFVKPLVKAKELIESSNKEAYYIIMVSDGSPNEGSNASRQYVLNNLRNENENQCLYSTRQNPCITIFSLGVDNANTSALNAISGNIINQNSDEYSFLINANQTVLAFTSIIAEIVCRIGPVFSNKNINVFNQDIKLRENVDYVYDDTFNIIKFYDEFPNNICEKIMQDNTDITIRSGRPKLIVK
jgi:uncharacterized protein YegL